eukprot:2296870-Karenia_brevis.AAC.1
MASAVAFALAAGPPPLGPEGCPCPASGWLPGGTACPVASSGGALGMLCCGLAGWKCGASCWGVGVDGIGICDGTGVAVVG